MLKLYNIKMSIFDFMVLFLRQLADQRHVMCVFYNFSTKNGWYFVFFRAKRSFVSFYFSF